MGLFLKIDLDTFRGPTKKPYVRIDQLTVQRESNRMIVSIAMYAHKSDVKLKQNIPGEAIYYRPGDKEGESISIPLSYTFNLSDKVKANVPIYQKQKVVEKIPYVSFDPETGDEITAYEEVEHDKVVKVGEEDKVIEVDNWGMIQQDVFGLAYTKVKEAINKLIPDIQITQD